MNSLHLAQTALQALLANKPRTFLTLLGITIGVASIIIIMSVGQGGENLIVQQIQGFGSNMVEIAPGQQPQGPSDFAQLYADSLKPRDVELLAQKQTFPHIERISPVVFTAATASYGTETYRGTLLGVSADFPLLLDFYPSEGVFFSEEEVRTSQDVVVIGSKVKEELFGLSDALHQRIKIKNKTLRVIGVLEVKGKTGFLNYDEIMMLPYPTAQQYITGTKYFNEIIVGVDAEENVAATVKDIETALRNAHNITDPAKDDFSVNTQADAIERLTMITGILTGILVSVAAVSLVVGGIGIMNIMLVSVTERTQEIGLRKALGATNRDIMNQFLIESALLTSMGGLIGIVAGALLSFAVSKVMGGALGVDWRFAFPVLPALVGITISALVGLVFGLYPAKRASEKNPIEALRYE